MPDQIAVFVPLSQNTLDSDDLVRNCVEHVNTGAVTGAIEMVTIISIGAVRWEKAVPVDGGLSVSGHFTEKFTNWLSSAEVMGQPIPFDEKDYIGELVGMVGPDPAFNINLVLAGGNPLIDWPPVPEVWP